MAEHAHKAQEEADAAAGAEQASGVHEPRQEWTAEEMRAWEDAVAAVKRVAAPTVHRVTATGAYDSRGPPRALSLQEQWCLSHVISAVAHWNGHDSNILLATGGEGVNKFTTTQLGHQKWLVGPQSPDGTRWPSLAPEMLLSEFPPDPSRGWHSGWHLAGHAPMHQRITFIKDLCQRHRGEVREIKGDWVEILAVRCRAFGCRAFALVAQSELSSSSV